MRRFTWAMTVLRGLDGGARHVDRDAERAEAVAVRRRDLHERHVEREDAARGRGCGHLREEHRQVVGAPLVHGPRARSGRRRARSRGSSSRAPARRTGAGALGVRAITISTTRSSLARAASASTSARGAAAHAVDEHAVAGLHDGDGLVGGDGDGSSSASSWAKGRASLPAARGGREPASARPPVSRACPTPA